MSTSPKPPSGPSLETLLRLKRAERPDAEFWQEFDRGLRHKQLAAIVAPKPWWLGLSLLVRRVPLAAWSVPAGAAAALLAVLSLSSGPALVTTPEADETATVAANSPALHAPAPVLASVPYADVAPEPDDAAPASATTANAVLLAESAMPVVNEPASVPEPASPVVSPTLSPGALANAALGPLVAELAPAALPATDWNNYASLAQAAIEWPTPADALGGIEAARGFPVASTASATALAVVSELDEAPASAEIPQPANPRHARLLAAASLVPDDAEKALAHARERVVHRLADGEELYASVTRLGVRGDRLSLSF